jgi:Lrp/AsnC family leucine-responsive transcriptional regulator
MVCGIFIGGSNLLLGIGANSLLEYCFGRCRHKRGAGRAPIASNKMQIDFWGHFAEYYSAMALRDRTTLDSPADLDPIDRRILALLQQDAKRSQADVAKEVGLTAPSVNERIRKLERAGFIRGYVALLDDRKLGYDITAFVEVFVEHPKFETPFIEAVAELDEVLECHHITGEFSLLLKVKVTDMAAFRRLLIEKLNTIRGVRQTRTVMVLSTWKEQHRIKVD